MWSLQNCNMKNLHTLNLLCSLDCCSLKVTIFNTKLIKLCSTIQPTLTKGPWCCLGSTEWAHNDPTLHFVQTFRRTFDPPLKKFVSLCSENTVRVTRSVTRGERSVLKHKAPFGSSSFFCVAMSPWNVLPAELILWSNFHTFSCLSKGWLFVAVAHNINRIVVSLGGNRQ